MAFCKHCQVESTLSASGEETCPNCGMPYEFSDDDWDLELNLDAQSPGSGPDETAKEIEQPSGEETEVFRDLPDPDATAPPGPTDSDNLAGREAAVDMTHAFGGRFADDSWDDVEEIALGEEDEEATAGPGDVTAPFIDPDGSSAGEGSGTARERAPDTDRLNPDATIAFDSASGAGDPSGLAGSEAGPRTGPDPGMGGETMGHGAPPPPASSPAGDTPALPDSAAAFGTLPAGLSGSDRDSEQPPSSAGDDAGTRGEDIGSRGGDSGTLAVDSGSDRRSDRVETPKPREITGLESGQTVPRGVMGDDHASQSLRPGDTHVVGPENVRLRAYRLGDDKKQGPSDFLVENGPFQGGMGVVYGMRQGSLDRRVAVKQVKPEMSSNESDRNKFISEAVITGQLEHPNIIPVHDLGLASDGLPFYSMKFVEGDEWEKQVKKLSEDENLSILIQVSQAIAFAHSRGIIHRDLKPGNVMLGEYGEVLVMDWGLAARLENAEEIPPSGTPVYMPPETALQYLDYAKGKMSGKGKKSSSTRRLPPGTYSDIYLLGGLLFKIVTGRAPHRGKTTFECLKAAARNELVKTSKRSELLDIAYKAMRTDPGERHRDVNEFIDEIRAYQAHAQSNKIAKQANQDLKAAEKAKADPAIDTNATYASYSSAQHGFRNALDLWGGNRRATRRLVETKRKYAETAYGNGDFDLALSLLDPESGDDEKMITEVRSAQKQRNRQLQLFRTLQYGIAASFVVAIGALVLTAVLGYDAFSQRKIAGIAKAEADRQVKIAKAEQDKAQLANDEAKAAKQEAKLAKDEAKTAIRQAKIASNDADAAKNRAKVALDEARVAKDEAKTAKDEARVAKDEAQFAKDEVVEQQYEAVRNSVRSVFAERGAFAASKELRKTYREDQDQDLIARGLGWAQLLQDVNWDAEDGVEEVINGLASPLVATSHHGAVSAVLDNNADRPMVSVYRGTGFAAAAASWPIASSAKSVAVSPDGRAVAVVGEELALYTTEGEMIAAPEAKGLPITTLAFDPRGGKFLTGDQKTGVALWQIDVDSAKATIIDRDARWHRKPLTVVGYSPDGELRFDADSEGRISVWRDNEEGSLPTRWPYSHSLESSGSPVITAVAMASQADGAALTYGCRDGAVYVLRGGWAGQQEQQARPAIDERNALTDRSNQGRDNRGWINQRPDKLNTLHASAVTSVAFAEEGCVVVSTGGARVLCRRASANANINVKAVREYHDSNVLSAAVTPEGKVLTTDDAGRVVRWSVASKPNPARLEPAPGDARGPVTAIGVDPEQSAVVVGDGIGFLRRWDDPFASLEYDKRFAGHEDHRRMRAWLIEHPTPCVVTVGADRLACVWDPQTGALRRTLELDGRHVVTLSADRQSLIAATDRRVADKPSAVSLPLDGGPAKPLWSDSPRVAALHAFRRPGASEQTIAVGLRDGQIYLWTPSGGRQELASSIGRPHWRLIRAIAYDANQDALLAIDYAGLLTRWSLGTGEVVEAFAPGKGTPRHLQVAADRVLIVRDRLRSSSAQLVDSQTLRAASPSGFASKDLRDATFSATGDTVLAMTSSGQLLAWSDDQWRPAAADGAMERSANRRSGWKGVRTAADGAVMLFGDGRVELWSSSERDAELLTRIASRTRPLATLPGAEGGLSALSQRGWLDAWPSPVDKQLAPQQRGVGSAPPVIAACPADPGRSFAAVADGASAIIQLRDLATGQPLGESHRLSSARVAAIDGNDAWLAAAIAEPNDPRVELIDRNGGVRTTVHFDESPRSIAVAPSGDRIAVLTKSGIAYAQRAPGADQWATGRLDREAVTAIEFTPEGDRLMTGDQTGQLAMLAIDPPRGDGDGFASRVVLTLSGHSDAVSLLHFATLNGRPALLSGDRSGAVLVKQL